MVLFENKKNAAESHFNLLEEIEAIISIKMAKLFNPITFAEERNARIKDKRSFFCNSVSATVLAAAFALGFIYTYGQFTLDTSSSDNVLAAPLRRSKLIWLSLVTLITGLSSFFYFKKAAKIKNPEIKQKLLDGAFHFGQANMVYDAVEIILDQKIPVFTDSEGNGVMKELSLHTIFNKRRQNAMLALLGSDDDRRSLWIDGKIPMGPIWIPNEYRETILGELEKSYARLKKKQSRNIRDSRYLKTALLYREHMENSFKTMNSPALKESGARMSIQRKAIKDTSKLLLDNWSTWEKFRSDISKHFTTKKKVVHSQNEYKNFCDSLWDAFHQHYKKNETDLPNLEYDLKSFLMGESRTAATYFDMLMAIPVSQLVEKNTKIA